jgi:hypothetical protein
MQFVPIPTTLQALQATSEHWLPFLPGIARRSKEPAETLLRRIASFEVQLALVWDGKQALALLGLRYSKRGEDLIGEVIWLTGRGMKQWQHLLPQLEKYLKDMGCREIRPICRPGWSRLIKPHGYKITHYVMEKVL